MCLLQCPPLFCCCLFVFDPEAIICHLWGIESKWPKKHMYECQLIFKQCSSSMILIIIHVMNSQICGCCNVHHCFAVSCSYLTHRPSFATGEESRQNDWRSTTCMGTSIVPSCNWSILIISHILNSQICGCCNGCHCCAVPCSYLTHRPWFDTGNYGAKMNGEAPHAWAQLLFPVVAGLYLS
jgi:hypothetical protein